MKNLFKNIFIWWNQKTIGTMIYTFFYGKFKGMDEQGNKYYESTSGKRWVIYKKEIEASSISSEWYLWIHFMSNTTPSVDNKKKYFWEKERQKNLTGTSKMYRPKKIVEKKNVIKKYDTWKI